MPAGRFVDLYPVLIVTTASLRAGARSLPGGTWDVRRFRPNIVVEAQGDDWLEDAWVGSAVTIGEGVQLTPTRRASRCTMVTRPQPGIERDLDIFRILATVHGADFGVWADVSEAGTVEIGDSVSIGPVPSVRLSEAP